MLTLKMAWPIVDANGVLGRMELLSPVARVVWQSKQQVILDGIDGGLVPVLAFDDGFILVLADGCGLNFAA